MQPHSLCIHFDGFFEKFGGVVVGQDYFCGTPHGHIMQNRRAYNAKQKTVELLAAQL